MINKFTILGERCSGTCWLFNIINENFYLTEEPIKFGWKHFFGFTNFENFDDIDDVLFIGIVRNPFDWVNSLYKNPHHLDISMLKDINTFLNSNVITDKTTIQYECTDYKMTETNFYTETQLNNIIEMRNIKLNYLINDMPKKVKNYILIRYEDLRDNFEETIELIRKTFNLEIKDVINYPINVKHYKHEPDVIFKINNNKPIDDILIVNHSYFNKNKLESYLKYVNDFRKVY